MGHRVPDLHPGQQEEPALQHETAHDDDDQRAECWCDAQSDEHRQKCAAEA